MTAAAPDPAEGLTELLADGESVAAGGRTVQVRPLTPRQLPRVLAALQPLQGAIGAGLDLERLDATRLMQLAMNHTEDVVQFVALATRQDPDWVGDGIDAAELLDLLSAVLRVNAGFFAQRVVPALMGMMQQIGRLVPGQT